MDDFIAFLVISASFILAALVSAKKKKSGQAQKPLANPTPVAPHRETLEEYLERQKRAAEARLKEAEEAHRREEYERRAREARAEKERISAEAQQRIAEEGRPSEEIADALAREAEQAAAAAAGKQEGALSFDPEEMVIYSEILAPRFEEY